MKVETLTESIPDTYTIISKFLQRDVIIDFYLTSSIKKSDEVSLLLINDGQDLLTMNFNSILEKLSDKIAPLLCVGIHCGPDRRNEYGTAGILDYKGRGAKAALYTRFIFEELIPFIRKKYSITSFKEKSFCGFSLGGLSALDIVWNHPEEFLKVGVFSGSLWWRSISQDDPGFIEEDHRIMHNEIRNGKYYPWLKFFFETGTLDETADRNENGIIDSIDDTVSLIDELIKKGYNPKSDIYYKEIKDGHHDVVTWARAFPEFLKWGWGIN
ncbi:MAG TPA: alpha/beta hydrolase-fold protein [Hanamia sp.]|nr:alpha/beta hydrolase-fold protein [Hanamia sp.]